MSTDTKGKVQQRCRCLHQGGISLIEMMVGIAVGLVCVLVIVQILASFEGRKRTTSSGTDAQSIGTIGAFSLDRDFRLAGYGFGVATSTVMGCNVVASNSALASADVSFLLRPVDIVKGATEDKPDTVRVLYGNSAYFVATQPMTASEAQTKALLKSRDGFQIGDKVVVTGGTPTRCQLVEITGLAVGDTVTIEHEAGKNYTTLDNVSRAATMNPVGGTGTLFSTGTVFNLGQAPVQQVWAVDATRHTLTRYNRLAQDPADKVDVASDVVTFKAQYGIDANDDGKVASSEWTDTTTATTDWTKVRAIRFALLIRSRHFERPNGTTPVTPNAPQWADGSKTFQLTNLDGSTDSGTSAGAVAGPDAANNWRNYRYRVYENVVPLRNMIWGTAP